MMGKARIKTIIISIYHVLSIGFLSIDVVVVFMVCRVVFVTLIMAGVPVDLFSNVLMSGVQ